MYEELEHWKQYKRKKALLMKSFKNNFGFKSPSDNSKKLFTEYNKKSLETVQQSIKLC